jgi:hypothetical protein
MDDMTSEAVIEGETLDVGAWLSSVSRDPLRFVLEGFEWGRGELANAKGPEPWQEWALKEIRDKMMGPGEAIAKLAVASGHGVGKSTLAAWIILWGISTSADCRGLVTGSTEAQVMQRLRAELKIWARRSRLEALFELGATALVSTDPAHAMTWRVDMVAWTEARPTSFAGLHNSGRRLVVVVDEASGVPDVIFQTLEGTGTDASTELIFLMLGNPLSPSGYFFDAFNRFSDGWSTRHVDSREVSFTNKQHFERIAAQYGVESDYFKMRVTGHFPSVGASQFLSPALVTMAMERPMVRPAGDPLVLGVDCARYGPDNSVLFPRRGLDARTIPYESYNGLSIPQLEEKVIMFVNRHPDVMQIHVDGGGLGAGVVDHLRLRLSIPIIDVVGSGKPDQGMIGGGRYANKRAESYGVLKGALETGLCLPNDRELLAELTSFEYLFDRRGDILLESKIDLKRRGVESPDRGDALALTYAAQVSVLPPLHEWAEGQQRVVYEYNPYSSENIEAGMRGESLVESRARGYVPGWAKLRSEYEDGWSRQDHVDAWASDAVTHRGADEGWE